MTAFPASIPAAALDTILSHLALLFLTAAGGDMQVARDAAAHMLLAHDPRTETELALAAEVVGCSLYSLEALAHSKEKGAPVSRTLRLWSSAVSLNREAHRSWKKLDQVQRDRRKGVPQPEYSAAPEAPAEPAPPPAPPAEEPAPPAAASPAPQAPEAEPAVAAAVSAPEAKPCVVLPRKPSPYSGRAQHDYEANRKRLMAQQMAEANRRRQADHAALVAAAEAGTAATPAG
jgi:hypothetical protein